MDISGYEYSNAELNHSHEYLLPKLLKILNVYHLDKLDRVFDLGCGNGSIANYLSKEGYSVYGVDPSKIGIEYSSSNFPNLRLEIGHSGDNLLSRFGTFKFIYSLEVIEHIFDPLQFIEDVKLILEKNGILVLSTPYHGYLKNLMLSIFNKWDKHFTVLWKGGHIKFWSVQTITQLLTISGFEVLEIKRVGRVPIIAKSMIVIAKKVL